jgi:hypothetical protein
MTLPKSESDIKTQIKLEYNYAYQYMNPRRIQVLDRLRLFSNQRRDKELVGDTTLFTVFQTVLSQLYEDRLSVTFEPGHPDDTDKVDVLGDVAKYDFDKMDMEQVEYDWDWYTAFWGAGFLDTSEWNSKKKLMAPSVIDNATFLIDPDCTLINGDARGFGAARYWGREITFTKAQMRKRKFENIDNLKKGEDASSLQYLDKQQRRSAQNLGQSADMIYGENENIPLLEWWTIVGNEKWLFTTDLTFQVIVRAMKAQDQDEWPLEHRKLFPIPGDPFGVSIPDLVEDKQRAKSILTNLGLMHAKADLYPMYVYDRNSISPTTDLSFAFNKWIPSDGPVTAAVQPLPKQPIGQLVSYIMDTIDQAAQRATAATAMQQGVTNPTPRSANESVRVFNQAQDRISTGVKIFAWSERGFWKKWLKQYKRFFVSANSKFIRIEGPFGPKFIKITGDSFDFEEDPDIYIESKILSDAANQDAAQRLTAFNSLVAQDQTVNRRYLNKKNAKVIGGFDPSEVNRIFPETPDEMKAEQENYSLDKNKLVKIDINDDHNAHLLIHAKADDTKAAIVHIEAHKRAIMLQRQQQQQASQAQGQPQTQPGAQPLSTATTPNQQGQGSAPATQAPTPFNVQQ